jgi:hypothetical protein
MVSDAPVSGGGAWIAVPVVRIAAPGTRLAPAGGLSGMEPRALAR